MQDIFWLFLLLVFLFFLTGKLTGLIFRLFFLMTRSQKTAIIFLTVLLLPGTIIHELSHLITALVLRVPAGKLTVIPKIQDKEVHAGSVMVGRTDPFRLTLIGLAPLPLGIALLYFVSTIFFPSMIVETQNLASLLPMTNDAWLMTFIGMYLLFTISCSMFSSKKDLKALLISGPALLIVVGLFYWAGIRIGISPDAWTRWMEQTREINAALGITACVDAILAIILLGFQHLVQQLLSFPRRTSTVSSVEPRESSLK